MSNLENLCRVCLGIQNLTNIFILQDDIIISEKIVYCASVQIAQNDCLPKMICEQCLLYLEMAYAFKTVCETTDKKLRNLPNVEIFPVEKNNREKVNFTEEILPINFPEVTTSSDNCDANTEESSKLNISSESLIDNDDINVNSLIEEKCIQKTIVTVDFINVSSIESTIEENSDFFLINQVNVNEVNTTNNNGDLNCKTLKLVNDAVAQHSLSTSSEKKILQNTESALLINEKCDVQEHQCLDLDLRVDHISEKLEFQSNPKEKVGRHISKKITGKYPQRLQHTLHDKKQNTSLKNKVVLEESFEYFVDMPETEVPIAMFEETVITEKEIFLFETNNSESNVRSEVTHNKRNIGKCITNVKNVQCPSAVGKLIKNSRGYRKTKTKIKIKIAKSASRKGSNRKINVSNDLNKKIKIKLNKKLKQKDKNISLKKADGGFKCETCDKSFLFRSHLIRHLNKHTGIKRYKCEYCEQKFVSNYNLSVHILKHTGKFPIICEICEKGFPHPSLLKRHMTFHTGETNFHCKLCSASFTQSSSLTLHEKMHKNKPTYQCDVCYKIFSYISSLTAHKKLHFNPKRFSCNVCLSTFSRKFSLMRHMRGHSKSKKIKCKFCDAMFNNRVNYQLHLKNHSKYKCDSCSKSFQYKASFTNHLKQHKLLN